MLAQFLILGTQGVLRPLPAVRPGIADAGPEGLTHDNLTHDNACFV